MYCTFGHAITGDRHLFLRHIAFVTNTENIEASGHFENITGPHEMIIEDIFNTPS